jgi:peptidoglycan/xylan/chitin deacetylase (PgdA/CDA1 family)
MDRRSFLTHGVAGLAAAGVGAGGGSVLRGVEERRAKEATEKDGRGHGETRVVYSVSTKGRVLALTFDDGPHPRLTPPLLDLLEKRHLKATFFMVGEAAQRHPDIVKRIVAAGHEVANHSWSHPHLADLKADGTREQVVRGSAALTAQIGKRPRWFRPPRGVLTGPVIHAATAVHQDIAMWSASFPAHAPLDSPKAVADKLMSEIQPGAIIDLHDGTNGRDDDTQFENLWSRELAQLPAFFDAAEAAGYRFLTLSELDALGDRPGGSRLPARTDATSTGLPSEPGG